MSTSEAIQIAAMIFGIGSVYGLIRADLLRLHEKISDVKANIVRVESTAEKAHERIDDHINRSHLGKS